MKIVFAPDAFDPSTWTDCEAPSLETYLSLWAYFGEFPSDARIYHIQVSAANDVTPGSNENDIEYLFSLPGPFFIVRYPEGIEWIIAGAIALVALAATAYSILSIPNIPGKNQQTPSSNNSLSERTNQARIKQRIEDIFGELRSTPTLIQTPYRIFDSTGKELELSYMCIGRGEYDVSDVRDGDTLVSEITGESVEVYGPNTSPNGGSPILRIGDAIGTGIISVQKANGVNGQVLYAPNYKTIDSTVTGHLEFGYPNKILTTDKTVLNFTKFCDAGATLILTGATATNGGHTAVLDGTYIVDTVIDEVITLLNATSVTTDWNILHLMAGDHSDLVLGCTVDASGMSSKVVGPFILNDPDLTGAIANLVAQNGLFKSNGNQSAAFPITIRFGVTPVDAIGTPTGGEVTADFTLAGSGVDQSQQAMSALLSISSRSSVRAWRITPTDYLYQGTVSDELKWRDLYGTAPVAATNFGNVTTVQALTRVTQAALGVKERKLNMLVCRKVPARIGSTSTFGANAATKNFAPIICAIALDPYLGNRNISEIDVSNIYAAAAASLAYFGTDAMQEFSYTFDASNMTFENTIAAIAGAVFCTAYRRGGELKLSFEKLNPDSSLLFNHRNIRPGTMKPNYRWGGGDNDGVEYHFTDPADETVASIYLPEDRSAKQPLIVDSVGVRNWDQATAQAYRIWNKLRYQYLKSDFEATQEVDLLVRTNRIMISDQTRPDTQDGEIVSQDVLELELSQPFQYVTLDHVIWLQLSDGTLQAIEIASADASPAYFITLAEPPLLPLVVDDGQAAQTVYEIVGNSSVRVSAFLVDTKEPQGLFTTQVSAINYSDLYYGADAPGTLDFNISANTEFAGAFEDF